MRAAVLNAHSEPIEIADVDIDKPGPREVLVRTAAAGVCHTDLSVVHGKLGLPPPMVLGHESAGVVEAVGSQVSYVAPGDKVITCPSVFCGACEQCLTGHPNLCAMSGVVRGDDEPPRLTRDGVPMRQMAQLGSFAEQLLVHEHALVRVPEQTPLEQAALLGCGVTTGLGAVFNTAGVRPGEVVAVVGCGGVGLNVVQGARIAGAARVIAIDRVASRLEFASRFGATETIDASATDPVAEVLERTGGGVDHAFEVVGRKATTEQAFGMLKRGGTATAVGALRGEKIEIDGAALLNGERKLQGSRMGSNRFRVDIPRYLALYEQGRLLLDELVTSRVPLDEIETAFAQMEAGEGARTLVVFDGA